MKTYTYKIHLEPEPEGGFTVTVPALPGCVTWGATHEEALRMAQEAIEGFLQSLAEIGAPIPQEQPEAPLDSLICVEHPSGV